MDEFTHILDGARHPNERVRRPGLPGGRTPGISRLTLRSQDLTCWKVTLPIIDTEGALPVKSDARLLQISPRAVLDLATHTGQVPAPPPTCRQGRVNLQEHLDIKQTTVEAVAHGPVTRLARQGSRHGKQIKDGPQQQLLSTTMSWRKDSRGLRPPQKAARRS